VAEEAFTLIGGAPNLRYAHHVFTVEGAMAQHGVVRLDIAPIGGAGRIFTAIYISDAMFAVCSEAAT
jgi:hypothetical protein